MGAELLKQSEIFAFLAAFFLIAITLQQKEMERQAGSREHPPIIRMSERSESFRFELGSAEVSPNFRAAIENGVIPQLEELSSKCECDAIEVVGHTDGARISQPYSDLDAELVAAFKSGRIEGLHPGSNTDLGMVRALAVINILKESRADGRLQRVNYFFPYSAGQMILPDQRLTDADRQAPDPSRRRIEIRLLKASERRIEEAGQ